MSEHPKRIETDGDFLLQALNGCSHTVSIIDYQKRSYSGNRLNTQWNTNIRRKEQKLSIHCAAIHHEI